MKLDFKGTLELNNQEFFLNMKTRPPIQREFKERLLRNISKLLPQTQDTMERVRINTVIIQLNEIKAVN